MSLMNKCKFENTDVTIVKNFKNIAQIVYNNYYDISKSYYYFELFLTILICIFQFFSNTSIT